MIKSEVFQILDEIARGMAVTFGKNCETLIQDYSQPGHPILSIYNNHISGREVGFTLDDEWAAAQNTEQCFSCSIKEKKLIKSTSFNFSGDGYSFRLGINLDFTLYSQMKEVLDSFIALNGGPINTDEKTNLSQIFEKCIQQTGVIPSEMKRKDRIVLIRLLKQARAFEHQRAVPFIADQLGVSRYTIYTYLKEV